MCCVKFSGLFASHEVISGSCTIQRKWAFSYVSKLKTSDAGQKLQQRPCTLCARRVSMQEAEATPILPRTPIWTFSVVNNHRFPFPASYPCLLSFWSFDWFCHPCRAEFSHPCETDGQNPLWMHLQDMLCDTFTLSLLTNMLTPCSHHSQLEVSGSQIFR